MTENEDKPPRENENQLIVRQMMEQMMNAPEAMQAMAEKLHLSSSLDMDKRTQEVASALKSIAEAIGGRANEAKGDAMKESMVALTKDIEHLREGMGKIEKDLEATREKTGDVSKDVTSLVERTATWKVALFVTVLVGVLSTLFGILFLEQRDLRRDVSGVSKDIVELRSDVKKDVVELRRDVGDVKKDIADLKDMLRGGLNGANQQPAKTAQPNP